VASPAVHHNIVALVPVALVEHAELLRRLRPRRACRGGCIWVERYAPASSRRPHTRTQISVEVLRVVRVEGLAGSPLVSRVFGHQRASCREDQPPGVAVEGGSRGPGAVRDSKLSWR
jgi:hypothetical protein